MKYERFQHVLGFVASIGLATAATSAFSLVGVTTIFGDSSDLSLHKIQTSARLLGWSSACFILSLSFICGSQLLYTSPILRRLAGGKGNRSAKRRFAKTVLTILAWLPLASQIAALALIGQALFVFASGPARLATYGIMTGAILCAGVYVLSLTADEVGQKKLRLAWTFGGILPWG